MGAQGVAFLAGYALNAALLVLLTAPEVADFGRLQTALRWICAGTLFGLPTGLLRLAPERRADRGALFLSTAVAVALLGVVAAATLDLVPWLRVTLLREGSASAAFAIFAWKAPFAGLFAVSIAAAHASGAFRRQASLETVERAAVLVGSVTGAASWGLRGLVVGSLVGSAVAASAALIASWPHGGRARFRLAQLVDVARIGRARTGVQVLETLRPVALLQILTLRGGGDAGTALLYGGMLFTLPLVAVPERLAQAVYPTMVDEDGETAGLDARSRRLTLELLRLSIPILAVVGVVLTLVLPQLGDGRYAAAVPSAWILLAGVAAQGCTAHLGYLVLVRHRLHLEALASAAALAVTCVSAWYLVPLSGATGAAAALTGGLIVRAGLLAAAAGRSGAERVEG